jgi:hypothetical protein
VFFPLLKVIQPKTDGLMSAQATGQKQSKKRPVSLSLHAAVVGCLPKCMALFGRQPVPQANAKLPDAFDPANASSKVGAEESTIGGLVGKPPYCAKPEVDRAGGQLPALQVVPVSENHDPIKRETRFGAIPVHELVDCMSIATLCVGTAQAVENCRLRKLEIRQAQDGLGLLAIGLGSHFRLHGGGLRATQS